MLEDAHKLIKIQMEFRVIDCDLIELIPHKKKNTEIMITEQKGMKWKKLFFSSPLQNMLKIENNSNEFETKMTCT